MIKERPNIDEVKDEFNRIDEKEVREIINKVPKGKAAGEGGRCAEFLQNLGDRGITTLTGLLNKIYTTGDLPQDFIKSVFVPIPKVAKTMECNEYRTISLISHAAEILLKVIKKRMTRKHLK